MKWCAKARRRGFVAYDRYCGAWICGFCGAILVSPAGGDGLVVCVGCGLRAMFDHWEPKAVKSGQDERGAELIEVALLAPLAILALFCAINLLLIVGAKTTVDQASHYGAVRLVQDADPDLACQSALALCSGLMPPEPRCSASLDGDALVTVTYDFQVLAGGIVGLDGLVLTGETRLPR